MQKVVDILERYCQWIAVGIGAIFFLFALYQYLPVVSKPVTATLGGQVFTPGEVDREIVQTAAEPLESKMSTPATVKVNVPNYSARVTELMTAPPKVAPLSSAMAAARRVELPELPWEKERNQNAPLNQVVTLPALPSPVYEPAPTSGFAQVTPVVAAQPPGNPAVPNPAGGNKDVVWVRVPYNISLAQMDREFKNANIPGALAATHFLRVELVRQKKTGPDTWGADEVVAAIETAGILPQPPANANVGALLEHNKWAIEHQVSIVQPPFYPYVAGDHPFRVEAVSPTDPNNPDGVAAFDPETYPPNAPLDKLTEEQKKQVQAVRQRRAKEAQDAARQRGAQQGGGQQGGGRGRGPGGGGPGGGGPGMRSDDGSGRGTVSTFQRAGQDPNNPGGQGYPGQGYPGEGGVPGAPGMVDTSVPPIGNQQFVPQAGIPDIQGYAFDVTAKPGATYRYRIRYAIANPMFNANAPGVGPNLAQQFDIVSDDPSRWTEPVTVKSNTHVFLQNVPPNANNVRFTLFHWQNGKWNRANQTFNPGDSIGKLDGEVDYRSNLTLVDVRRDSTSDRAYAILMSDDGSISKRDYDSDKDSQEFKDLTLAVDGPPQQAMPPGGPGGMPGGGFPGGGFPGGGFPGGGYPGGGPGGARP